MQNLFKQNYSLTIQPQQRLQCSFAMQQSLDILQMPIEDLATWLEKQVEENPLVDCSNYRTKTESSFYEIEPAYEPSLFEHLMKQARESLKDPFDLEQMEWIIGNLEDTGIFSESFSSAPTGWDPAKLESLLHQLQQYDPPGIGARSVQESLLLQLKEKGKEDSLGYLIIENHFEDLLYQRFTSIEKHYHLEENALRSIIQSEISPLDPFPGVRFQKNTSINITPDVFLREDINWEVEVNEEHLPSYMLKPLPDDFSFLQKEDQHYFKNHLNRAKWIQLALEKRKDTLLKITTLLTIAQKSYLKGNSSSLLPITIGDIAKKLGLHESTIARALNHKYLSCNLGIIPLKNLLSKSLSKTAEDVSSDKARKLLQKFIAEENKEKPLSDRELLEKMQRAGIPCARRTVTKYRTALRIPTRRSRKNIQLPKKIPFDALGFLRGF